MKIEGKLEFAKSNIGSKSENLKSVCIKTPEGRYKIQQQGAAIRNPALEKMVGKHVEVEGIIKDAKIFTQTLPLEIKK